MVLDRALRTEFSTPADLGRLAKCCFRRRLQGDELQARLQKRLTELEQERKLSPQPPVVVGGGLIVPAGLLERPAQGT